MHSKGNRSVLCLLAATLGLSGASMAQEQKPQNPPPAPVHATAGSGYVLGPGDLVGVHVLDTDEIGDRPFRIDGDGYVRLPLAGRVKASGLTTEQLEDTITDRLKTYIKQPEVTVYVQEYQSQRVSILGSVKNPGIHQLEGDRTLIEVLASAGGPSDDAGTTVRITRAIERGRIPLASATDDPTGRYSVADVNLRDITTGKDPAANILIAPDDLISVPRAQMVYVIGNVFRPGGYIVATDTPVSVLKVVSTAGGVSGGAAPNKTRILRRVAGNPNRSEIPVRLKEILYGKAADIVLQPEDILVVPPSGAKTALNRTAEAAVQIGTAISIYTVIY